jgi:SAM-dependent methyltransferase
MQMHSPCPRLSTGTLKRLYHTRDLDFLSRIKGRKVLDFGSGYGGRSAWMAESAAWVEGVEINQSQVDQSIAFACAKERRNIRFSLGEEERILFGNATFDVVVSFDVLEHVRRPDLVLKEMRRVLKPDGVVVLIFTPYFGMFSHHLNYITLLPALHWVFSPSDLIVCINDLMKEQAFSGLGVRDQPAPGMSFDGRFEVLPTLNGLTKPVFEKLVVEAGLSFESERATPILERFPFAGRAGFVLNRLLMALPSGDELFALNLVATLKQAPEKTRAGHV